MPRIPRLQLTTFETGGGWGLGDNFARLPPVEEQEKSKAKIYRVASAGDPGARNSPRNSSTTAHLVTEVDHSLDRDSATNSGDPMQSYGGRHSAAAGPAAMSRPVGEPPALEVIRTTVFQPQSEDDDNTFVDHGSVAAGFPSAKDGRSSGRKGAVAPHSTVKRNAVQGRAALDLSGGLQAYYTSMQRQHSGGGSPPAAHLVNASRSQRTATNHVAAASINPSRSTQLIWNPPRVLSRMVSEQSVRDMAVAPDGCSLWAVVGDEPPSLFEVKGANLDQVRSVDWLTQVYCIAVVPVPAAKQTTFKVVDCPKVKGRKSAKTPTRVASAAAGVDGEAPAAYTLWCGLSRGNIGVVDLQSFSDAGTIANAHDQTVNRIWHLENGRVWSAGRDKSVKVWDPQNRRLVKKRSIAAILEDLCYVSCTYQVWAIAKDNIIRVYEAGGGNVRVTKQSRDKAENAVRMKGDLTLIRYHDDAHIVWAGLSRGGTALMDPDTYEVLQTVPLTISALVFHSKTAIITGHGALLEKDGDCIAVLDVTSPQAPSLLYCGVRMDNVDPTVGICLFKHPLTLGVVAQRDVGKLREQLVSVFVYEDTVTFTVDNGVEGQQCTSAPPQRKERVSPKVPPPGRPALLNVSAMPPEVSPPMAVERRGPSQGLVPTSTSVHDTDGSGVVYRAAALLTPASGLQRTDVYRGSSSVPSATPEVLTSISQMDKKLEDVKTALAVQLRSDAPLKDFSKIHKVLTQWMVESVDTLAALPVDEIEAIEKEYTTVEGKTVAMAVARLRRAAVSSSAETSPPPLVPSTATTTIEESSLATTRAEEMLTRLVVQERQAHQLQVDCLQRHNRRIIERHQALTSGLQHLAASVQTLSKVLLDTLPENEAQTLQHYLRGCAQTQVAKSTSAAELQQYMSTLTLTIQQVSLAYSLLFATPRAPLQQTSKNGAVGQPAVTSANCMNQLPCIAVEGTDGTTLDGPRPDAVDTCSSTIATAWENPVAAGQLLAAVLAPRHLLALMRLEMADTAHFLQYVRDSWGPVRGVRRLVDYLPYTSGRGPDLTQDIMKCVCLWDLATARMLLDLAREECFLTVMEALVESRSREFLPESSGSLNSLRHNTTFIPSGPYQRTGFSDAVDASGGDDYYYLAADEELSAARGEASQRLVELSIDLENASSQVRQSLQDVITSIPIAVIANTQAKGFAKLSAALSERLIAQRRPERLKDVLFWSQLCAYLLALCLNEVRDVLCNSHAVHPIRLSTENFFLISDKLTDWQFFLNDEISYAALWYGVVEACSAQLQPQLGISAAPSGISHAERLSATSARQSSHPSGTVGFHELTSQDDPFRQPHTTLARINSPIFCSNTHISSKRTAQRTELFHTYAQLVFAHQASARVFVPTRGQSPSRGGSGSPDPDDDDECFAEKIPSLLVTSRTLYTELLTVRKYCVQLRERVDAIREAKSATEDGGECDVVSIPPGEGKGFARLDVSMF